MRSQERVDLRETTRLSIRLNWQGNTPPDRGLPAPQVHVVAVVPDAVAPTVHSLRVAPAHDPGAPPALLPLDNVPDRFRGPPPVFS